MAELPWSGRSEDSDGASTSEVDASGILEVASGTLLIGLANEACHLAFGLGFDQGIEQVGLKTRTLFP